MNRRLVMFSESGNTARWWLAVNEVLSFVFGHFLESIPSSDGAEGTFHVRIHNLQAVDVGCIDPSEAVIIMLT